MQETPVQFLGQEDHWTRDRPQTPVFLGFPCGSADKESTCNAEDLGWILWPREFHGLYSQTQLSDFHFHFSLQEEDQSDKTVILSSSSVEPLIFPLGSVLLEKQHL